MARESKANACLPARGLFFVTPSKEGVNVKRFVRNV